MYLLIKYSGKYICSKENNRIGFIEIPSYKSNSDFYNIDIFISLLCAGLLNNSYEATKGLNYSEGLEVFEFFDPDSIKKINKNTFFYNLDENLKYLNEEFIEKINQNLKVLPGKLVSYSYQELLKITEASKKQKEIGNTDEEEPVFFDNFNLQVDDNLLTKLNNLHPLRTSKDVLLLYSAGKDSTLAAIRLRNAGYNVHFIHFDNGSMLDVDKPYLTFEETFSNHPSYYFNFENQAINIEEKFKDNFSYWKRKYGDNFQDSTLDSEIRCLSCRLAMYEEALIYAKKNNFKYIAEGARICQKFMLEQPKFIEKLQELAAIYQIELLFPVLSLEDDSLEKQELIENGFSSKSWESKCLIGRCAKEKTPEDEKIILDYYNEIIKPKVVKMLKFSSRKI